MSFFVFAGVGMVCGVESCERANCIRETPRREMDFISISLPHFDRTRWSDPLLRLPLHCYWIVIMRRYWMAISNISAPPATDRHLFFTVDAPAKVNFHSVPRSNHSHANALLLDQISIRHVATATFAITRISVRYCKCRTRNINNYIWQSKKMSLVDKN